MAQYKLSYFAFPGGRGEDCRLAMHVAGVDFEDDRVPPKEWPQRKASTPYGAMPVLEVEGKGTLAQSNAILAYLGRATGLHPGDSFEAARHEAVMASVEELRHQVQNTFKIKDDDDKKRARIEIAEGPLRTWAANVEAQITDGPFFSGADLNVVDLKLLIVMKWFATGGVDHIEPSVFDDFPKLKSLYQAAKTHPKVAQWYEIWGEF